MITFKNKDKKILLLSIAFILLVILVVTFLVMRDTGATRLKPGDTDLESGCIVAPDGRGLLCED